jgi:NAD(P)-dependent dehydrogenase (short-subunit alcohol dehydrogenase family)
MASGNILVTGASTGIGRACAIRCAELGYRVFAGVRNRAAEDELRAAHSSVEPVMLDVTDPDSIHAAVRLLGGTPLAGLINNAGISVTGPLELVHIEDWRRQFDVNVIGLVAVTQAFLPSLREARGRIVNIGSIAGRSALPVTGPYDASKFAVEAISDSLRLELQAVGVRVSLIEPGAIATPIWGKAFAESDRLNRQADRGAYQVYVKLIEKIRAEAEKAARTALPVETVVKAVEHALTARRPKTRYVVGREARFWLVLNLLPDRWRDWLILTDLNR